MALSGGRNNYVFRFNGDPDAVCIKIYASSDGTGLLQGWTALHAVAGTRIAPVPIRRYTEDWLPAIVMSWIPGEALNELELPLSILSQMVEADEIIQSCTLPRPLSYISRGHGLANMLRRVLMIWPKELAREPDPFSQELLKRVRRWEGSNIRELLHHRGKRVLSHGDGNALNWHSVGVGALWCVDFEFAGWSYPEFDAAEIVEHFSMRRNSEALRSIYRERFSRDAASIRFFEVCCELVAIRWLAVLWRHRVERSEDYNAQLRRALKIL